MVAARLATRARAHRQIITSLSTIEAKAHENSEKLDRVLNMLQAPGSARMSAKPADVIEWSDINVREEMAVGAGGFGRVFLGEWMGNLVRDSTAAHFDAAPPPL